MTSLPCCACEVPLACTGIDRSTGVERTQRATFCTRPLMVLEMEHLTMGGSRNTCLEKVWDLFEMRSGGHAATWIGAVYVRDRLRRFAVSGAT